MITNSNVADTVLAALRGITGVTVFDGMVPDTVPKDAAGFVRPYIALYVGNGVGLPTETHLCGGADTDSTTVPFTTIIVAASAAHVRAVSAAVCAALTNLRVGSGLVLPVYEQHTSTVPAPDPGTSPVRYFLPLQWGITTQ